MKDEFQLPFCGCNCGGHVSKLGNRFIRGHHVRGALNPMKNPAIAKKQRAARQGKNILWNL